MQLEGLIDLPALEGFLRERLPRQEGELVIEKHEAGFSNETFYISWGPKHWVMRRPPRGDILPTAHDVLREYRVLSALAPTGVRVCTRSTDVCCTSFPTQAPSQTLRSAATARASRQRAWIVRLVFGQPTPDASCSSYDILQRSSPLRSAPPEIASRPEAATRAPGSVIPPFHTTTG